MNSKDVEHWLGKQMTFGLQDRVSLYDRLARFTENGIPASKSIESMLSRFTLRKDLRAEVFKRIHQTIMAGGTIEAAFKPYLPPAELQLISAGETSGNLSQGFFQAKFVAQAVSRMKGALIGQMVYPVVLLILLTLILYMLASDLMPVLENMLEVHKWPWFAQVLKSLADWLLDYGMIALVGTIILLTVSIWSLPHWVGNHPWSQWSRNIRSTLDKFMPPFSVFREYQSSTFLIALGSLMSTGSPVNIAIEKIAVVASDWSKIHFNKMSVSLHSGRTVAQSISTGMIDQDTVDEIEDYENANALESTLSNIGEETIERSIARLNKMGMVIRLVMFALVMVMIVWIYSSLVFVIMKVAAESKRGF